MSSRGIARSSRPEVFLEISQNSQEITCARDSILIKLQAWDTCFCGFCEISQNAFFRERLRTTASVLVCFLSLFVGINLGVTEAVPRRCSVEKVLLKISLRPATLLKKKIWRWCFPVSFVKFLRTPFFTEHLRWLLLYSKVFLSK